MMVMVMVTVSVIGAHATSMRCKGIVCTTIGVVCMCCALVCVSLCDSDPSLYREGGRKFSNL